MEDISSPISSDDISQESIQHWENLRSELKDWKKKMKMSEAEIAAGLRISRQATNKFINETNQTLPVYRNNLIWLWEYITREDKIEELSVEEAKVNRRKLREETANNILEKSGFLGIERQLIIKENLSTSEKFHKLIFRLSNKSLSGRDIWNIEETVINQLVQAQSNSKSQTHFEKISKAKQWLESRYENVDTYWKQVESSLEKYKRLGKKSFTEAEIIELFQNITENKKNRNNTEQCIRVLHCETKTFDSVYKTLLAPISGNPGLGVKKVLEEILKEGILTEQKLRGIQENSNEFSFNPMNEFRLKCKLGDKEILWFYRSCSSSTSNMISAIQEGMAHDLELKDLSSHLLAEGSDSIVRVSAILKSNNSFYTGRWVDIDMLLSFAQAIVIAAEDWIKDSITDQKRYYETCRIFAENSEKIDILIAKTYEYGFTYTSDNRLIEKAHPVTAFEGCVDEIDSIPNTFNHDNSSACRHYRNGSEINKRQAQLAQ